LVQGERTKTTHLGPPPLWIIKGGGVVEDFWKEKIDGMPTPRGLG